MNLHILDLFDPTTEVAVVRGVPLWNRVADRLRQEIFTGKRQPGQRLIETRVARDFGVAQSSVREALHNLEKEGLVRRITNIGCCVTDLNEVQIEQMYTCRAEMEGFAVELLGKRNDKNLIRLLDEQFSTFQKAAAEGTPLDFTMADLRFHSTIWALSGNEFLSDSLSRIVIPLFAFWTRNFLDLLSKEERIQSAENHRQIIDLLRVGENISARRCMKTFIIESWMHTLDLNSKRQAE